MLSFSLHVCVHAKSLQSCPTLCDPMDCSPPGSSVHGIFQARILEWVAIPSSRGSRLRNQTSLSYVSCIVRRVFTTRVTWEALHSLQVPMQQGIDMSGGLELVSLTVIPFL